MGIRRSVVGAAILGAAFASAASARIELNRAFRFPEGKPVRIVVLRPDVEVGSLGAGGVEEPNADWTAAARARLIREIAAQQRVSGNDVVFLPEQQGANAALVADYEKLFAVVAGAVAKHKLARTGRLPTKRGRFDWTLGPGAARLGALAGGDYALFVRTHDAFGSVRRKALQLAAAGLLGVGLRAGVHHGYAALVELRTGDLVWCNVDTAAGGDPRTDAGAIERVGQLLTGFPAAKPALQTASTLP